jgi:hypothetical protein
MADHPIKHIVVLMFENRKGAPANDRLSSVPEHWNGGDFLDKKSWCQRT